MMTTTTAIPIPNDLLDAVRSFPCVREVEHCGVQFFVPPFDIYANCPSCGGRIKVRSFSGAVEIEDVFDAVLEWLNQPEAPGIAKLRQESLAEEE